MVEPPYGIIANELAAGRVVPFLGAGASLIGRPPSATWTPDNTMILPSGVDLAHFLADEAQFPSKDPIDLDDLAKVPSYYAIVAGRRALRERLQSVLKHRNSPGPLHHFLAKISAPLVVVVTNYDTLLEQAFIDAGKAYDLIIYPADRKDIANAVLWWPHGKAEPLVREPNKLAADIDLRSQP